MMHRATEEIVRYTMSMTRALTKENLRTPSTFVIMTEELITLQPRSDTKRSERALAVINIIPSLCSPRAFGATHFQFNRTRVMSRLNDEHAPE